MKAKYLKIITLVISLIGVALMFMSAGGDESSVGMFINFTKVLLYATVAIVLIFSIMNLLKNPQALKKTIIGLVIFGIIFAISYAMADGAAAYNGKNEVMLEEGSTSRLVDAGIKFSMLLGAIAFIGLIFDTVKSLVKS